MAEAQKSAADQAPMEKYRKVRSEREEVPEGVIRVNRNIQARVFIDQVLEEFNTKKKDTVTLSSLGEAITKSVTIAEIVKHRVKGLHQVNEISTIVIDDEYEPLEEGLDKMTVSRKLTCLQIILSKKQLDKNLPGYQEPIPDSEVNPDAGPEDDGRRQGGRRGARPNTTRPKEESKPLEEEKKAPAQEESKGGRSGASRRRRQRGGSGENRRGGRGGAQGAQNDGEKGGAEQTPAGGQSQGRGRGGNRGGDRGDRGAQGDGNQQPRSARRGRGGRGGRGGGENQPQDRH